MRLDAIKVDDICQEIIDAGPHDEVAREILEILCRNEHPEALFAVGIWSLEEEYGFSLSPENSLSKLELAAHLGSSDAAYNLALMYELGKFVDIDDKKSCFYYLVASLMGVDEAISDLEGQTSPVFEHLNNDLIKEACRFVLGKDEK